MATPTRELAITYGAYTVTNLTDYYTVGHGADLSLLRFEFEVNDPDATAFAALCVAAETAFRTPYQSCTVVCRTKTLESFSHSSGTGFNSKSEIIKQREGSSAGSRFYTVEITFGRPADVYSTDYRRNSTVKISWTTDRRAHIDIDGVYTVNGSTSARAQYLAAIGDYASDIITALGGDFDLLEENVVNDDQNKVASFHRKYDEQIDGRNEAEIVIDTLADGRKRVTISGMYSTILVATSSFALYSANYPAFSATVLGAISGTFQSTGTHVESNDTDLVTTFTNVYEETRDSRQSGSYQVIYATDRRITVIFEAAYYTGIGGANAYTLAKTAFPAWAESILTSIGGTFKKRSESYRPNDIAVPNECICRLEYLEAYTEQAPTNPAIRDQNYTVQPTIEAPGDSPNVNVQRMIEMIIDYTATIDHTEGVNLKAVWASAKSWLVSEIVKTYQAGVAAVIEEKPKYNPDNNILSATLKIWIPPSPYMLYRLEVTDSVDQGMIFDGLWTGNPMNFHEYEGHAIALRKVTKTYRRTLGADFAPPLIPYEIDDTDGELFTDSGSREGGPDPFAFGGMKLTIIHREQPKRTVSKIGIPPNQIIVEDISFTVIMRVTQPESGTQ